VTACSLLHKGNGSFSGRLSDFRGQSILGTGGFGFVVVEGAVGKAKLQKRRGILRLLKQVLDDGLSATRLAATKNNSIYIAKEHRRNPACATCAARLI
jgi:hypothetical protein